MSAYIVDEDCIRYLVSAATSPRIIGNGTHTFRWHWNITTAGALRGELYEGQAERAAAVGQMLWSENWRSVCHRYGEDTNEAAPVYAVHRPWFGTFDPVQVLKTIACLSYQSCERPDYESTEAHAFLASLKDHAIASLPGYDAAEWGAPEEQRRHGAPGGKPAAGAVYSISEMMKGKPLGDCEVPR